VIHPALVDSAPPEVGGRWSPLGSAGPAVVAGAATGSVRPSETTVVIGSTGAAELRSAGATVVIGSAGSTELRSTRSTRSAAVTGSTGAAESTGPPGTSPITLLLLRGWPTAGTATTSTAGPTSAGPLAGAALRSARRGAAGLRNGESGTGGEGGEADADQDGGRTCRAFEVHGIFPFEVSIERE
jgi:hypothetical protein